MPFSSTLTESGLAKINAALTSGESIDLRDSNFAVGDGNGLFVNPDPSMTSLVNEQYREKVNSISSSTDGRNAIFEFILPEDVGPFTIREWGMFDIDGNLFAIGNFPNVEKSTKEQGVTGELVMRGYVVVNNIETLTLTLNTSIVQATRDWVTANFAAINQRASQIINDSNVIGDTLTNALNWIQDRFNNLNSAQVTNNSALEGSTVTDALDAVEDRFTNLAASLIDNDSNVVGDTVADGLELILGRVNNLNSDQISNSSSFDGETLTNALTTISNRFFNLSSTNVSNSSDVDGISVTSALNRLGERIDNLDVSDIDSIPAVDVEGASLTVVLNNLNQRIENIGARTQIAFMSSPFTLFNDEVIPISYLTDKFNLLTGKYAFEAYLSIDEGFESGLAFKLFFPGIDSNCKLHYQIYSPDGDKGNTQTGTETGFNPTIVIPPNQIPDFGSNGSVVITGTLRINAPGTLGVAAQKTAPGDVNVGEETWIKITYLA